MVTQIRDNLGVELRLNTRISRANFSDYDHAFYLSPLDSWFDYRLCRKGSHACGPDDIACYPIRQVAESNDTFARRRGTYRYLDMDVTIRETLECAACWMENADPSHISKKIHLR